MNKGELLYEGKGEKLFLTQDENLLVSEFKDDLTAFNAEKKGNEAGKGALNCKISTQLFHLLEKHGIQTHLVETLDDTHQLIKKVKIIPVEDGCCLVNRCGDTFQCIGVDCCKFGNRCFAVKAR